MTPVERQLAPPGGWRSTSNPRIAPLSIEQFGWPMRPLLRMAGKWAKKRTGSERLPDIFLVLMRHPVLFRGWLYFASRLMPYGTLSRKDSELCILRVGWNTRCRYEWGQHVAIGLREGLSAEEIARVAKGPDAAGWSEPQSTLIAACDDLLRERSISDATWARLSAHYRDKQLIEIGMLIGHYEMLAGVINSLGIALEPEAEAELAAAPIHA